MASDGRTEEWVELISTVLLALATVATAWAGYQASRWHGEQAKAQAGATATRLESTRASGVANRQIQIDVAVFTEWVDARAEQDPRLARFYRERFTERFKPAFRAWVALDPLRNRSAPPTPFVMPQYELPAAQRATRLEAEAEKDAADARTYIQRANDYVLAVVFFATALFFGGLSTKLRTTRSRAAIVALGSILLVGAIIWVATFPVSIEI